MPDQLTPNFRLSEFLKSGTAERLNIRNVPTVEHVQNLVLLAVGMEQVRNLLFGNPIRITSGYRNPIINAEVGGSKTSAHALGYAADFTVETYTSFEAARDLAKSPLVFDQLIYEPSRGVVHISFDPRCRRQVMTQRGGPGSPLEKGIVK